MVGPRCREDVVAVYDSLNGKDFVERRGRYARYIGKNRRPDVAVPMREKKSVREFFLNTSGEGQYFTVRYLAGRERREEAVRKPFDEYVANRADHAVYFSG